jgi:Mycotoxin biosynthesis protein UstYa
MTGTIPNSNAEQQCSNAMYSSLLNRDNLALGAIERINIARRILHQPELTMEQAKEMGSHSDEYVSEYWNSSMSHGGFWTTDQAAGKPNFIEGGQANRFGFTQSIFHKLHCLANLRMMLAWYITGNSDNMTRDMNAHAIHCLVSVAKPQVKAFSCLATNLHTHQ